MPSLVVTVRLWVKDARFSEFADFETRAFKIMAHHGVEIVSIVQDHAQTLSEGSHETHILKFPDSAAFEAYRADLALLALSDLRDACTARTKIAIQQSALN